MSEPNHQNIGSQGNQGQQGNVAGDNYGVQITINNGGQASQQRKIDRDICRQMLEEQRQLTSNTVIGQVYGDRNLIDEDLFVDLALVKPKRSENQKHPQDIDPERGSELFTRQDVEKRFPYQEFLKEVIGNRTEKKIAIIGEPGAGKTTLLQKLAFWLLQETDDLVVWVSLAELGNQPLGEYLEEKWIKEAVGQSREEIKGDWEQKFKGGAVWLLLDGLDEMSQTDQQALKFRGWVTDARMIVTCRLNLWQANPSQLQGFQTYLTQPFQDEQMQEFIRRWFRALVEAGEDVKLAESLWSELQGSGKERIKDLCRNPLRLTLLCSTWKVDDALPETTAQLYEGFVKSVYGWKETAFPVTEEEKQGLNAALGELAKASLEAETSRFRLTHRLVCEYLGKPKAAGSLFPLALKLGWLNEVGVAAENPCERVYAFYHATFQEHFAALAVEDSDYFLPRTHVDCPVEGKRYRIFEPQWKQVILLWLGREDVGSKKKKAFIEGLVEFKDGVKDFYKCQAYFLAAAGINEFKACSRAAEIVRQVVKWGFGYFDVEKQGWRTFLDPVGTWARKVILETIRQLAITELIEIIEDCPDEYTRWQAAESLWKINPGNPQAIAGLLKLLLTTKYEYTRREAAKSLGEIGVANPEAIAGLLEVFLTSEDERTRGRAAESLGRIGAGNPEAIAGLLQILRATDDEDTRRKAVWTLGKIGVGNPEAISGLLEIIRTTENKDTRGRAAESLGKIGVGNPEAISGLLEVFQTSEDESIPWWAAESLRKIGVGNPEAISGLLEIIRTTENEDTREQAAKSLGAIGAENPQAIAGLREVIRTTENEYTRMLAAASLREIDPRNPEVITGLLKFIRTTENEFIRWWAAASLEKIDPGNPEVITGLLKIIRTTENESNFMLAAASLEKIDPGNPEVITGLLKIIRTTENESTRWEAIESLEKIGVANPEVITGLLKFIRTTENESIRWQAAKRLGKIGVANPQTIAGLLKIIRTTKNESTRWQAAWSLGKIDPGNPEAIAGLLKIIRTTENEYTRMLAAASLREIDPRNPEVITGLLKIIRTTTDDGDIPSLAARHLEKIGVGNPEAIAGLLEIIHTTKHRLTCCRAAWILEKIGVGSPEAIAGLVNLIETTDEESTCESATGNLQKILTTSKQYAGVVSALKHNLNDEVYQNHFYRFYQCHQLILNCAENLPYPEFYQAWHPTTPPHPEVTEQTLNEGEQSFASPLTCESLQHLPIYCLNAAILANETCEGEIALTLCRLIWKQVCPQQMYPRVSTPAELCYSIDELKFTLKLPQINLLITDCKTSTPELIAFCQKLTGVIAIAFLTEEPLEAPLKGFPANQPHLISAIETWLEEI